MSTAIIVGASGAVSTVGAAIGAVGSTRGAPVAVSGMMEGTAGTVDSAVMRVFNAYPGHEALIGLILNSPGSNGDAPAQLASKLILAPTYAQTPLDAPVVTPEQARQYAPLFFARLADAAAGNGDPEIVAQSLSALEAGIGRFLPSDVHHALYGAILMLKARDMADALNATKDAGTAPAGESSSGASKKDLAYLRIAYQLAERFSTDPSTQNGAILVNQQGEIVALGTNHFPRGVEESPERWAHPKKYSYVEHAERGVLFDALRQGIKTLGLTMYCPWFACDNCARAIIEAGIKRVIGHQTPNDWTPDRWKASIAEALTMLKEGGVETRWVKGLIGGVDIRFNGEIAHP